MFLPLLLLSAPCLILRTLEISTISWVYRFLELHLDLLLHNLSMLQMYSIVFTWRILSLPRLLAIPLQRLLPHDGVALSNPTEYRSMVGALQYLTFTRPDLAFSVQQLCQFMSHPTTIHLEAAKRVLRYLRGILYHGISFSPGPLTLTAFLNAD